MSQKKARIKDIAAIKVQKYIKETDYSPNIMAQVLKSSNSYRIVSLLPEPTGVNSYWLKHPEGIVKALEEPFPLSITQITFDMQSEEEFRKKTNEVLKMQPDGVLLAPIFKTESIEFCKTLSEEKIPFVFIDGFIESTDFLAYIGENNIQSGRVAGQLIEMVTDTNKDVLIVNIARNLKNVHHLNKRTEGFLSYFKQSGCNKGRRITISIPDPSSQTVRREMDIVFLKYPLIGSIFISGSKSHLIARYIEEKGLKSINLIGYDLIDENVKYLKSGITRFLIGQRPEEQTYKGIKKLFEFLYLHKAPDKIEYLPVDIVTSENVDFFLS